VVLLTDGARGMHLLTADVDRFRQAGRCFTGGAGEWADRDFFLPASTGRHVVTTGAGDAATAGLLYGVLAGKSAGKAASIAANFAAFKVDGGEPSSFSA
jgi:sugar/nucleoside kinase (ribokinase family)